MSDQGVVLFGGSFNPIHFGHLIVARSVLEHLGLDRIVLIPSAKPPHKRAVHLAEARHRLEMARLAVGDDDAFEVCDMEIRRTGPSYTVDTLEAYRESMGPDATLYWVIGGDSLPELHSWYRVSDLVDLATIVTAVRPGFESPDLSQLQACLSLAQVERLRDNILPTPRIDISATDIRRRITAGRPIRYLVPEAVRSYIATHGLYRDDA
jgi:nicotinate-nucleotide adenylyltransferase